MTQNDWREFLADWKRDLPLILSGPLFQPTSRGQGPVSDKLELILFELGNFPKGATVKQLAGATGIEQGALNGLVLTLVGLGLVRRAGRRINPGNRRARSSAVWVRA